MARRLGTSSDLGGRSASASRHSRSRKVCTLDRAFPGRTATPVPWIYLVDYIQKKSLFGYLKLGRRDAQAALIPHYVSLYEPKSGVMGKIVVETEPAVTDAESLALVQNDQARAALRKGSFMAVPGTRR